MTRPLKVFKTHIGFYDLVVAAPSMKAAAQAWGAAPTLFTQGFAGVTTDTAAVEAALAHPGSVLKRPHGQGGAYKKEPDSIAIPKATAQQKRVAKAAAATHRRKQATEQRARRAEARKAEKDAKKELAEIEQAEAALRQRRHTLRQKFHLHNAK